MQSFLPVCATMVMATLVPFLLLILLNFTTSILALNPTDNAAMISLVNSLKGTEALNWSLSTDPCSWPKVHCHANSITRIEVGKSNLSGTLPPDVRNLTSLVHFDFMFNSLSGPVPSLAGLSKLQVVLLNSNNFTSFPTDFFNGLTSLLNFSIGHNPSLAPWSIPSSVRESVSLNFFSAGACNLNGSLPGFFGDGFPSLSSLWLYGNNLSGGIPDSFRFSALKSLYLDRNALSGTIDVISNMTLLEELYC